MRKISNEEMEKAKRERSERGISKEDMLDAVTDLTEYLGFARTKAFHLNTEMGIKFWSGGDPRRNKARQITSAINCLQDSVNVLRKLIEDDVDE